MKRTFEPIAFLFPHPVVLVTCINQEGKNNIISISAITTLSRVPVLLGIAIHKGKYSGELIKYSKEFVVNIPGKKFLREIDICGTTHGNIINKFELTKLSIINSNRVKPKLINECPINLECKVINILETGEDDFFVGEVIKVHIEEQILQGDKKVDFSKLDPVIFCNRNYHELGNFIDFFGFSQKNHLL